MIAQFLRNTRGGVLPLVAGAMPLLIGAGAFAVDVASVQLDTRRLQGLADTAALAAASDPARAQTTVDAIVAAGWSRPVTVVVTKGSYAPDAALATTKRFTPGGKAGDAVRVSLQSASPTFLGRIFGQQSFAIGREATARRQHFAAFAIGSRLAALDAGLLNAWLSALTGSTVSLKIADYQALAGVDADLFGFLGALRTKASLKAGTYQELLNADVTSAQALDALAALLTARGEANAGAILSKLANQIGGRSVKLSTLIDAGPIGAQGSGGDGIARVDSLALVTALLQLGANTRQVSFDLGAGIPGLASSRVTLATGERMRQSPWIAISDEGTPVVRTAQARLYLETTLLPASLPGIGALATISVPVFAELAAAEGRVKSVDCAAVATRGTTIEARTTPGQAAIGRIDPARLHDFSTAMVPATATLVDTLLVDVTGSSRISLGAAEPWQAVRFTDSQIASGTTKTVRSTTPVGGVAASLAAHASLAVQVVGLPIPIDPLLKAVGGALSVAAGPIDSLLMLATGAVGVGIGEADVRVTGMRCGTAVLVA